LYMASLRANLSGNQLLQEYYGKFVGSTEGSVYPEWDPAKYLVSLQYDPAMPLYSFWDFGIGDLGVCLFVQVEDVEVPLRDVDGTYLGSEYLAHLRILDAIAAKDWRAADWADAWHAWLATNTGGRKPLASYGDPAGRQRAQGSGTSVIDDLMAAGVPVAPAPKKTPDYGARIIKNMMAGGRVLANRDAEGTVKVSAALASHRWHLDANGNRVGTAPVHDWTGHYADPLRYGAAALFGFWTKRSQTPSKPPPPPGTVGHAIQQLTRKTDTGLIGPQPRRKGTWIPQAPVGR
jgi:hypothetical protein